MKMLTAAPSRPWAAALALCAMLAPALGFAQDVPVPDKGDTAWMMTSTVLVILMTIPGLALFYGGMSRSKNVLSLLMQVFVTFCLIALLWAIYGYSLAFTNGNDFIGGFDRLFLQGLTTSSVAATFSKGVYIPEFAWFIFQLTFACITPCLIVGAFAERMKFSAVLLFMVLWFTFSYLPMAHMVWWWAGPDAYTDADAAAAATATAGFLFQKGALDFAGGTVVHINAGIAGLVGALMIGKRIGYGSTAMPPHNLPLVMIGASLLWVGWFGFNVGSGLEANGFTAMVFANTHPGHCGRGIGLDIRRVDPPRNADDARCCLGCGGRPRRDHSRLRLGGTDGFDRDWPDCGSSLPRCGGGPEEQARLRRLAGCVWRALRRRHRRRSADGRVLRPGARWHRRLRLRRERRRRVLHGRAIQGPVLGCRRGARLVGVVAAISFKIVDLVVGLRVTEEQEREGPRYRVARRARVQLTGSVEGGRSWSGRLLTRLRAPRRPLFFAC